MPGFDLARLCAREFPRQAHARTLGVVLLNHGIFSFGSTARESYERMIALVGRAEDYLRSNEAWCLPRAQAAATTAATVSRLDIARLRAQISICAGFPVILATHDDAKFVAFARRADIDLQTAHVLDIGCGTGAADRMLRPMVSSLAGADVSSEMVAEAKAAGCDIDHRVYDGEVLPFDPGTFDLAFAFNVMHHVPPTEWAGFADQMMTAVRPASTERRASNSADPSTSTSTAAGRIALMASRTRAQLAASTRSTLLSATTSAART